MAVSPEHQFLSEKFLKNLEDFSRLRLYGYTEAERKKFDFACVLQRDWDRPLVGQTLWKHEEGIDKDVRTLLTESRADIWAYVVRDSVKNRRALYEVVQDFQRSEYRDSLFRLKVFWVPHDFDADSEDDRNVVAATLRESMVKDLLFNVVFGNLNAEDIKFFLNETGIVGLNLAVLYEIAIRGFMNYPDLSRKLEVSPGPLRERVLNLMASGMIWQLGRLSLYYVSLKGRVFLELLHRIRVELHAEYPRPSPELLYILDLLGLDPNVPDDAGLSHVDGVYGWTARRAFNILERNVGSALRRWDINLASRDYVIGQWERDIDASILQR